jgi:hypothetical protein
MSPKLPKPDDCLVDFARTVADMRQESLCNGNSKMILDEINAEIQAARMGKANLG